jgi:hypothetical protein
MNSKLNRIAKNQAKALKETLELLESVGESDSDMRVLIGEISRWQQHVAPFKATA